MTLIESFTPIVAPSPYTETRGVSPVPIEVPSVISTTPALNSASEETVLLSTSKSETLSELAWMSSLNVTVIVVTLVVIADIGTGPAASASATSPEPTATSGLPAISVAVPTV